MHVTSGKEKKSGGYYFISGKLLLDKQEVIRTRNKTPQLKPNNIMLIFVHNFYR